MLRREPLSRAGSRALDALEALRDLITYGGALTLIIALSVGVAAWPLFVDLEPGALLDNQIPWETRTQGFGWLLAVAAGVLVLYAGLALRRRALRATLQYLNRRLLFTLALPLLPLLSTPKIEQKQPLLTLLAIALFGVAVAASVYHAWPRARPVDEDEPPNGLADAHPEDEPPDGLADAHPEDESPNGLADANPEGASPETPAKGPSRLAARSWRAWLPWLSLSAVTTALGIHFFRLTLANHMALRTQAADLGYYENIFAQTWAGNWLGISFLGSGVHYSVHFDPILILLTPIYALYPHVELLLGLQIAWVLSTVAPLYLLGRELLGRAWIGLALAAMFLLYPLMQGVLFYDFHSIALVIPLMAWLLWALLGQRWWRFYGFFILALLVREDVPLMTALLGATMFFAADRRARLHGLGVIALSAIYFIVVKRYFMVSDDLLNCTKGGSCLAFYFKDLIISGEGTKELGLSVLTNPEFLVKFLTQPAKLIFLGHLLIPLLAAPLFSGRKRWFMLLYGAMICFLSTRAPVHSLGFQYSALIFAAAFPIIPWAWRRARDHAPLGLHGPGFMSALIIGALAASALSSWKYGAIVENHGFRGGFSRPVRALTSQHVKRYEWLQALQEEIPRDAKLSLSKTLAPHFSGRLNVYRYPHQFHQQGVEPEYFLIRRRDLRKKKQEQRFKKHKKGWTLLEQGHGLYFFKVKPKPSASR